MQEIEDLVRSAWQHLRPHFDKHPDLLTKRLARRNSTSIARPPRAWCLAVRATDTRLDHFDRRIPTTDETNQVHLDTPLLRKLCAPVKLDPPGEPLRDVANKLGVTPIGLRSARLKGLFHTRHLPQTRPGKPIPLLYTPQPLDPAGTLFA